MKITKENFNVKYFTINKLFGQNNVNLDFSNSVNIYVGENGIGKTTILNILYYTLSLKLNKLQKINFESIELVFFNGEKIHLEKKWMNNRNKYHDLIIRDINRYIPGREREILISLYNEGNESEFMSYIHHLRVQRKIPLRFLRSIENIIEESDGDFLFGEDYEDHINEIEKFKAVINKYIKEEIFYFPTYRRIEQDLKNLGVNSINERIDNYENNEIIKFGMDDVKKVFANLEEEIKNFSLEGYSRISGQMITHLVQSQNVTKDMKEKIKKTEFLEIVLERIGESLPDQDKITIRELIKSEKIFKENQDSYNPLIFFLFNLIKIYEGQKDKDEAIKEFSKICNRYLVNKEVKYDESAVSISIVDKRLKKPIELINLSSGEKQIISLFTKIYLTSQENFIILFDEPELSLSIEWQEKLLPDIINSEKCKFLFAVTHSPFVFNNSLDKFATSMELFIEEVDYNEEN